MRIVAELTFKRRYCVGASVRVYLTADGRMYRCDGSDQPDALHPIKHFYADPQFYDFDTGKPADGEILFQTSPYIRLGRCQSVMSAGPPWYAAQCRKNKGHTGECYFGTTDEARAAFEEDVKRLQSANAEKPQPSNDR